MSSAAIRAEGLDVRVRDRALLEDARLSVDEGEIVLLAGPSGSGKSVLLKILSGLVTPRTPRFGIEGKLEVLGKDVVATPGVTRGRVGLVFQEYALFEGLTANANIRFALDHRRPAPEPDAREDERKRLLDEVGLAAADGSTRVETLSGGQRQRVAIARALAFAPDVLAYDEPTSGLDPAMRDRIVAVIEETARKHGTTTLVVTHDLRGLLGIADRVILLDPTERTLVETPPENAEERLAALEVPERLAPAPPGFLARQARRLASVVEGTTRTVEGAALALLALIPRWRSLRWGLRFLGNYLKAVAGPGALLYFLLAGAVIGLVSTYFTFTFLPYRKFTESLILDDLTAAVGFGLHRILVPLIMTLLLAARAGAAVSADVSTRVMARQTDAMESLGVSPPRYLLTGAVGAFLLGAPLIAVISFLGARIASAVVFASMAPDVSLHAWTGMFHRLLDDPGSWLLKGSGWVAAKTLGSAFGIGAIAYFFGIRPKRSPEEVARAITATVIAATVLVLTIHMVFALVEF